MKQSNQRFLMNQTMNLSLDQNDFDDETPAVRSTKRPFVQKK